MNICLKNATEYMCVNPKDENNHSLVSNLTQRRICDVQRLKAKYKCTLTVQTLLLKPRIKKII